MKLHFPPAAPGGPPQPLVVTGETGRGDLLYVRTQPDGRLVFGLDHWGVGVLEGQPQAVEMAAEHAVVVRMGSFYSSEPKLGLNPPVRQLNVTVDGREVLEGEVDFYRMPTPRVFVGYNPIGGSSTSLYFSGGITEIASAGDK